MNLSISNIKKQLSKWWWAYCLSALGILCILNSFMFESGPVNLSRVTIDGKCNAIFALTNNTNQKLAIELSLKGYRSASTGRAGRQVAIGQGSYTLNPKETLDIKEKLVCTSMVGNIIGDAEIVNIRKYK